MTQAGTNMENKSLSVMIRLLIQCHIIQNRAGISSFLRDKFK